MYDYHKSLKAKMVPFAGKFFIFNHFYYQGYSMPVFYAPGGMAEHYHCRDKVSIFDVSPIKTLNKFGVDGIIRLPAPLPSSKIVIAGID